MRVRFFLYEATGLPHIYHHGVNEEEVEDVVGNPGEDRPGREVSECRSARLLLADTSRAIYVRDPEPDSVLVITTYELSGKALLAHKRRQRRNTDETNKYPSGWNKRKVSRVLRQYESQTEADAIAEDEVAFELKDQTVMVVPRKLVPEITV